MQMENKIEIVEQPVKKIVILSSSRFSLDEFFQRTELMIRAGQPFALNWVEGVVFIFSPYLPDSEAMVEEALQGIHYWSSLAFAAMPKYEPIKRFGAIEIPIINQSSVPELKQVGDWLKQKIK
jgi:hypothetical protein